VRTRIDPLKANDSFLLCTDGLYNSVADRGIRDLLAGQALAADTAAILVAKTLQNRARDNMTAVVVKTRRIKT
jgi:serine/threonine protein phosphatase PrpC